MADREFPIMQSHDGHVPLDHPLSVPWGIVESCRGQMIMNHGQTPDRLAQRGGLSPGELRCAVEGRPLTWAAVSRDKLHENAVWLRQLVEEADRG